MVSVYEGFSQQSSHRWRYSFQSPRDRIDLRDEDEPYAAGLDSVNASEDIINRFMSKINENYACPYKKRAVARFCSDVTMEGLERVNTDQKVSLLDETNDNECPLPPRGGLTAFDLYNALRRPRWAERIAHATPSNSTTTYLSEAKVNIRRIYIANLDRWTVLALAASASSTQARVLGEFIYRHLQFATRVSTMILTNGLPIFSFEIHLPFYALRKHKKTMDDHRRKSDGHPLRSSMNITFLRTFSEKCDNSEDDIIYEANISCLVSGWDSYSWVAYMFIDLYFEECLIDEDLESINDYEQHRLDGVNLDPFTSETLLNRALDDPREYFLQIFSIRLRRVRNEWENLLMHIEEAIKIYKSDYGTRFSQTESLTGAQTQVGDLKSDTTRMKLRLELQEWMKMATELLTKFIDMLQEYDRALSLFFCKGVYYFRGPIHDLNVSDEAVTFLGNINTTHDELGGLLIKLQKIKDSLCKDMSRDLTLRLAHENNMSSLFQEGTARDVRVLTWITFLSLPFGLAAALLSTEKGYMPINPTPWNLIITISILKGSIWIVLDVLRDLKWSRAFVKWVRRRVGLLEIRDVPRVTEETAEILE